MKQHHTKPNGKTNGFTRNSFKFISNCIRTVSSGVRSASASVAASISSDSHDVKDQVLWVCFDRLELSPSSFKRVLLLGYTNGFQVIDVDDSSTVSELVSKRDDPCTFLQMQPLPAKSEGCEGYRASHPLLLVAAGDETKSPDPTPRRRDGFTESETGNVVNSSTAVRFYSLRSHSYVHVLRFRSAVYTVRCSPRIVAVGLASQIYCFDALTLENKFSVLTYPVPTAGQGMVGINVGYGPMDVGPRWLAYASNNPLLTNTGRLSPQSLTPSPGVSPSTSPSSGSLVARYAIESSKQLAAGLINLGDMSYKTLSKYYQELLPDGPSSPVASNSGWKANKTSANSPEMDTAGTVIVKDFVSRAVIAQFRAHTSQLSALCFDPSGTLLVTASINGNNVNIFRIMPSCSQTGSGGQSCNWTSSHVHLYKLHRGITSAVIQGICFSQFSQWVSIVSSKGTCHIYVLSPFGGESGLQLQNSHVDGPNLVPVLSLPWWSSSSYTINQQSFGAPPPPPVTLSVVSRIRTGNSGWLNTVSSAASSAAGMTSTPSSAVSAVFHCSMPNGLQPGHLKTNALEHLLVYSPSGHVIQYELIPSMGLETTDTASRTGSGSLVPIQDEELRVKAEPVQWWDVCRRADWPEREECVKGITFGSKDSAGTIMETSDCENNDNVRKDEEPHEGSALYLSKAEVQMDYGRIPTWHNSKIHFFAMNLVAPDKHISSADGFSGEIEIEKVSSLEIEIKRKDLLPVFEHFHNANPGWSNRGSIGQSYQSSTSEVHVAGEKYSSDAVFYPQLVQNIQRERQIDMTKPYLPTASNSNVKNGMEFSSTFSPPLLTQKSLKSGNSYMKVSPAENGCIVNSPLKNASALTGAIPKEVLSSNSVGTSEASNGGSNRSDFSMNVVDEGSVQDRLDLGGYFQEEYCKAAPLLDGSHEMSEAATDVGSGSSPREKEKSEEDGENGEILGGVFAFSEEG